MGLQVMPRKAAQGRCQVRPILHVSIPTNRAYTSERNWGKPRGMDGLNEIIDQNRANKNVGAAKERENVTWCARFVRQAMRAAGYAPMTKADRQRCIVYVTVIEPTDSRDVPNVYGGVLKYALDALTARNKRGTGAIWDDNTKWMPKLIPSIRISKSNPGIEMTIVPLEDELRRRKSPTTLTQSATRCATPNSSR